MIRQIRPLHLDDLPHLSRFLRLGFHASQDADFAAPEVLHWKYLDSANSSTDDANTLSLIATDDSGRIIGHLGLCRTSFEGQGIHSDSSGIPTIHIIDWLGSPDHRSVGMSLMRRAHHSVSTQFGLGVSPSALAVGERSGYDLKAQVPAFSRVLRPSYWLRSTGLRPMHRILRLGRDTAFRSFRPPTPPRPDARLSLRRISHFGPEVLPVVLRAGQHAILTRRDPVRLNHMLAFPRQSVSGWHLLDATGSIRGFALLNIIPNDLGRTRVGKVVDCLLDNVDPDLWHSAQYALLNELENQKADIAQAYGSTPWSAAALQRTGYTARFTVKFHIRDRQSLLPKSALFHLTPLEGDYAYT